MIIMKPGGIYKAPCNTPVKTSHIRQCIDNVRDYDREHDRILNSVHHRLDLGPNMLMGAQQHTTVESTAALRIQDRFKGKYDCKMPISNCAKCFCSQLYLFHRVRSMHWFGERL